VAVAIGGGRSRGGFSQLLTSFIESETFFERWATKAHMRLQGLLIESYESQTLKTRIVCFCITKMFRPFKKGGIVVAE
jgi:hypothetical protein